MIDYLKQLALVTGVVCSAQTVLAEAEGTSANPLTPVALPGGAVIKQVDFERHIVPLLSRFGCNTGACHGSFQGRGGMRFSLFGHQPEMDYDALFLRLDVHQPEQSDALLKPTEAISHEGGQRFKHGSWPYQLMHRWITDGAKESSEPVTTVELQVVPAKLAFTDSAVRQLKVRATINDEQELDVTSFCRFTSGDEGLVMVDKQGRVTSVRPGATHVTVEYLGRFANVLTSRPFESHATERIVGHHGRSDQPSLELAASDANPETLSPPRDAADTARIIDDSIERQLRQLNLDVSPRARSEQLLRRVTLDTAARLPTPSEMQEFASDSSIDGFERVVDRLLASDRHAAMWATRFCDITRCSFAMLEGEESEKPKRAKMWHDWFRVRIQANLPYDQWVRGVLCGTSAGREGYAAWLQSEAQQVRQLRAGFETDYHEREFLDLYWRRQIDNGRYPYRRLAEITSSAFLGIQIECAQCHKHPYDRWTQEDYGRFVNVFTQVQFGNSTELNQEILTYMKRRRDAEPNARPAVLPRVAEVFNDRQLARPLLGDNQQPLAAAPLGGVPFASSTEPREALMAWMVGDGRKRFARSLVNRVWAHYLGRGLVEPVDGASAINPATHPELLDTLADRFIASGYDFRQLERAVLLSAAYQRSSQPVGNNADDERHYARYLVRPLLAEATVDVLHQSLGVPLETGQDLPPEAAAIEMGGDQVTTSVIVGKMLQTFGRGPRVSACDCDRQQAPSLRQALFRLSDPWIFEAITRGDLLSALEQAEPKRGTEILYARMLARAPTDRERAIVTRHLQQTADTKTAWADLIWALVNTREFLTNR